MGGWCFTLAFADRAGLLQLRWLMARLELEDTGAWDPVLERALHVAQRRWARKHLARDARWRAFNDVAARTGAELLVEWSAGEFAERTPEAPQPAAER